MMRKILPAIFALLLLAGPALAQPVTAPVMPTPTATDADAAPRSEMPLAPGQTADLPPLSQEKPGDDVLNKYYERCMSSIYTDLTTDAREEFCACSAAQMKDNMSAGEMTTLTGGTGGDKVDAVKLAVNVAAPCLAPVIQETEYNRCENDSLYVHMYKTRDAFDATCRCVGGHAGDYVQSYGHDLMAYTLALNPRYANDPALALREAPEYREEVAKSHESCMGKYVYH